MEAAERAPRETAPAGRSRRRGWLAAGIAGGAVVLLVGGWLAWRAQRPAGGKTAASGEFVGAAACAACHAEESAAWSGSQHALAMREASDSSVLGDFDGATFAYDTVTSTFSRRGDRFVVRTDGPDGKLADFEVRYTFGVYPLQQYLVEEPGGRLQALSIAWDARPKEEGGQRWFHLYPGQGITHGDELHWTGRQQNWNHMCSDCHSTDVQKGYDAGTDSFRTSWSELNVACEACHGPASRHIEWARAPRILRSLLWRSDGLPEQLTERRGVTWTHDPATGQPRRSEPRATSREVQLCAQCHSRRAQIAGGYTAGAPLMDHYAPALIEPGLYYPDGQQRDEVYTYGSFLQSRMFHEGVTCSDCHDPHTQKLRAPGNALCTQCHTPAKYDQPAHHHHAAGSTGALCASCHMPQTTYMQIDARRDHSIRVPRPDQSVKLGVPNACNRCHTDRSARWAADRVRGWFGADPAGFQHFAEVFAADEAGQAGAAPGLQRLATDPAEPGIVRASALARLAHWPGPAALQSVEVGVGDPDPLVRRATLDLVETLDPRERIRWATPLLSDSVRAVRTQAAWVLAPASAALPSTEEQQAFARAAEEFVASQRYNADRPESRVTLGTFLAQLGREAEAATEYRAALRLAPRYVPAYVNLADLLRSRGMEADAARTLRDGLAVAPDNAVLHHALGLSLARSGDTPGAVAELGKAASLAPDDARLAYAYAVALNSAGRAAEAFQTLDAALARNPDDRDLLFALATFHRDAGHAAEALRYAERLQRAAPTDPEARALVQSLRAGM